MTPSRRGGSRLAIAMAAGAAVAVALLALAGPARAQAAQPVTPDVTSAGRVFDGEGALSAGASSRLLFDYPDIASLWFLLASLGVALSAAILYWKRAQFGDRLGVILRGAPEVFPGRVPSLVLQPLVENAIRHGIEQLADSARLKIIAEDAGHEALVTVEDDGAGLDPQDLEDVLSGRRVGDSMGLRNVDERLRATSGRDGLTIETGVGAGTKVTMRLPKYSAVLSAQ